MLGKILSSQSRTTTVWRYDNNLVAYIIPLYTGLESCLGSNLEIVLDLRLSHDFQKQYQRISNSPLKTELLNVPRNQTPTYLDLSSKKINHKTIVYGTEVLQQQMQLEPKPFALDLFYGERVSSGTDKEVLLK